MYTIPTLGREVHKDDLLWAIWSPRDRDHKALGRGTFGGEGSK